MQIKAQKRKIPNGWQIARLGDHVDVLCGHIFKSKYYSPHPHDIPLLRGDNVIQGKLRWKDAKYWPRNKVHRLEKYHLSKGDLVIAMDGTLTHAGLKVSAVTTADVPCLLLQRVARLRTKPTLQQELLKQLLFSHQFEQYVKSVQTMTVVPHISAQHIKNFPVLLPPYAQQKIIIEVLQEWDNAIKKMETLMALKEQQFVVVRSILINNCQGKNFSLEELETQKMISIYRGNVISKKDIESHPGTNPIYSSSIKNDGLFGKYGHYMFDEELITWSIDGGGDFFHRMKHKFSVTNVCGYIKINHNKIDGFFLAMQLQFLHEKLTFNYQYKAYPSIIRNIYNVKIPPLSEQHQIAKVLGMAQQEIIFIKKLVAYYRIQKRGLMQKLFSCEWNM